MKNKKNKICQSQNVFLSSDTLHVDYHYITVNTLSSRLQVKRPYVLLTLQIGIEQQVGDVELRGAAKAR